MHSNLIKNLITYTMVAFLVIAFGSPAFAGGSVKINWDKYSHNELPKVYNKNKKGGPPPHAPAHGYRSKHQYRYYPDCSVYYDTSRKIYFYLKDGNWEVGASLPGNLQVSLGDSVSLEMDSGKPYINHNEHAKKYPPGKVKKVKQNKRSKK